MPKPQKVKIDKPRLIKEILVLFSVAVIIFLVRFIPWLVEQPLQTSDPYDKYQSLLKEVENYDYSSGPNPTLKNRLDKATQAIGTDPVRYFYNQKAKALYFFNIKEYSNSIIILDIAINFAPIPPEHVAIYDLYIKNYEALDNSEKVNEYQELRDVITH